MTQLEVEEILVMGHGLCGGCAAALTGQFDDAAPAKAISSPTGSSMLRRRARSASARAIPRSIGEAFLEMEREAVQGRLANLRTFPWIAERERDGRLKLHGCHFSIAEGQLYVLDEAEDDFRPA